MSFDGLPSPPSLINCTRSGGVQVWEAENGTGMMDKPSYGSLPALTVRDGIRSQQHSSCMLVLSRTKRCRNAALCRDGNSWMGMTARPDQPIVVAAPLAWHAPEAGLSLATFSCHDHQHVYKCQVRGPADWADGRSGARQLHYHFRLQAAMAKLGHKGGCSSMQASKWRMGYSLVLVHWHALPKKSSE